MATDEHAMKIFYRAHCVVVRTNKSFRENNNFLRPFPEQLTAVDKQKWWPRYKTLLVSKQKLASSLSAKTYINVASHTVTTLNIYDC